MIYRRQLREQAGILKYSWLLIKHELLNRVGLNPLKRIVCCRLKSVRSTCLTKPQAQGVWDLEVMGSMHKTLCFLALGATHKPIMICLICKSRIQYVTHVRKWVDGHSTPSLSRNNPTCRRCSHSPVASHLNGMSLRFFTPLYYLQFEFYVDEHKTCRGRRSNLVVW